MRACPMSRAEIERTLLFANAVSNLSVAIITAGIVAPLIGFMYGTSATDTHGWWLMIAVVWFLSGGALDLLGHAVLGRLK